MKGPSPRRLWKYLARCRRLPSSLLSPGDGRTAPQIAAPVRLWALLLGRLLREYSFYAVEALVPSWARRAPQVARLKGNLPELFQAAHKRFAAQPPTQGFWEGHDRVEVWDADDFDPWDTLRWKTVRVLRYRQYKPDGTVCEAFWLTDFPPRQLSRRSLRVTSKSAKFPEGEQDH